MFLITLAWKNLWRNRSRTFITMAALFFAVVLSIITSSLRQGIFENLIKNVVSFYTGYAQIHKSGYQAEPILENSFKASPARIKKILQTQNVSAVTARLESFSLAASEIRTRGCLIAGIHPEGENRVTSLRNKLIQGTYLEEAGTGVLLGEGLAEKLELGCGDTVILIGQGYHGATAAGKYPISGIARFGSPELNDKVIFMPIRAAQDFFSAPGMITAWILSMHNPRQTEATTPALAALLGSNYEVLSWGEMLPDIRQHIETDTGNARYVQGILYLLICFGIFGTLLMMMAEREFEMGMLLAIGMQRGIMMLMLLMESVFTVLSGCIAGMIFSIPLVFYFRANPLKIGGETAEIYRRFGFEPIFPTSPDAAIFLRQGIIILFIGLMLSLYPMAKALFLNPVKAMRK